MTAWTQIIYTFVFQVSSSHSLHANNIFGRSNGLQQFLKPTSGSGDGVRHTEIQTECCEEGRKRGLITTDINVTILTKNIAVTRFKVIQT